VPAIERTLRRTVRRGWFIVNDIEKEALKEGYFTNFLPHYLVLHGITEKMRNGSTGNSSYYWSAFGKLLYAAFENLRYLIQKADETSGLTVSSHLPTFMATYNLAYTVMEYLQIMMCLLEKPSGYVISKNEFHEILEYRGERSKFVDQFLNRIEAAGSMPNLKSDWDTVKKNNELRHCFTHRFRLLWWCKDFVGPFGFPRLRTPDENTIYEEIWRSVEDPNWEDTVRNLSEPDFESGVDMIRTLHQEFASIADRLFEAFMLDIQSKTTP